MITKEKQKTRVITLVAKTDIEPDILLDLIERVIPGAFAFYSEKPVWLEDDKVDVNINEMPFSKQSITDTIPLGDGFFLRTFSKTTQPEPNARISMGLQWYFRTAHFLDPFSDEFQTAINLQIKIAKSEMERKLERWIFERFYKVSIVPFFDINCISTPAAHKGEPILFVHPTDLRSAIHRTHLFIDTYLSLEKKIEGKAEALKDG